jgi:hypothetical protein
LSENFARFSYIKPGSPAVPCVQDNLERPNDCPVPVRRIFYFLPDLQDLHFLIAATKWEQFFYQPQAGDFGNEVSAGTDYGIWQRIILN